MENFLYKTSRSTIIFYNVPLVNAAETEGTDCNPFDFVDTTQSFFYFHLKHDALSLSVTPAPTHSSYRYFLNDFSDYVVPAVADLNFM